MSAIHSIFILVIGMAVMLAAGCTQPAPAQPPAPVVPAAPSTPALKMTVPFAPVPVPGREGVSLAYELELVPADGQVPVPEKVEVIDPATGRILLSADDEMLAALYHPAAIPPPTAEEMQSGTGKVPLPRISIWLVVSPGNVPDRLTHRLTLNRTASGLSPLLLDGGDVTVRKDLAPVVVGSPMMGNGWLAMETTSAFTHHDGAQITLNGVTRVPQRFAQDWILLDPVTGQAASGNASLARNYYGFGKEIHAVAAGTVVDAGDGIPDNELIYAAPTPTIATLAGNFIIVDIGNKKYACYAHMVNGSVRVKKGDVIREGQVLGLMGNSGNSDLPHLHFQVVTDNPTFLGSEGYPHVYRSFDVTGRVNQTLATESFSDPSYTKDRLWGEFGKYVEFEKEPVPQANRIVENNAVVRFS